MKLRARLLFISALAIVIVGITAAAIHFQYARPIGEGPAGPKILKEPFGRTWTGRPVFLVGLGDSVTAGFGARRGYSYFDRLAGNPSDEFSEMNGISLRRVFTHLTVTNLAISGSTSMELLERQLPRLRVADSNVLGVVVITTGGNDLIHNYGRTPPRAEAMYGATWSEAQPWIADYATRVEAIVQAVTAHFPGGCQIFVANIFDPTDGVGVITHAGLPGWPDALKILEAYNQVIEQCIAKHANLHLINMHDAFLGHGIHCTQFWRARYDAHDPHYWYFINLERSE